MVRGGACARQGGRLGGGGGLPCAAPEARWGGARSGGVTRGAAAGLLLTVHPQMQGFGRLAAYHAVDEFAYLSELAQGFKVMVALVKQYAEAEE